MVVDKDVEIFAIFREEAVAGIMLDGGGGLLNNVPKLYCHYSGQAR